MNNLDNIRAQREARLAAARKRRQKELRQKIGLGVLVAIALVAIIAAVGVLGALITMLGWNVGVVALVAACGGHVAKISFVTAICVNLALGVIGSVFKRPATA